MELKGTFALITGSAKRLGREIAIGLAEKGVNILLHYNRSKDEAAKTAQYIAALGVRCHTLEADLSKTKTIPKMIKEAYELAGRIDILVNNASIFHKTPLENVKEAEWDLLMATNLKAPFFLSKEIGLKMVQSSGGKIVNIADWSAFRPYKDYAAYCASKGALVTLTKSLARDLAPRVQVNAIAPGPILKPPDMSEQESKAIAGTTLLGRWGNPKDIANAIVFLLEDDFVDGTVLFVDGGRSIY